jgi:NADH dehydrogenase [ubiquinone] 1 alpha subcomplex assembly factor 7
VTPLETIIRAMIATDGPMRLDHYMGLCLGHPRHGYYMTRDPLGERGDFVTAPEVSQVFGELIGVWCISAWAAIGQPAHFNLVELGPGRGTLMRDLLRAARRVAPAFATAASVHMVETSPVLRALQNEGLSGPAVWHDRVEVVPVGPTILIANEFFDAIPVRQFERRQRRGFERVVGIVDDKLAIGLVASDMACRGNDGDVVESSSARAEIAEAIGNRLSMYPGVALIIDYGHFASSAGDTLQAMRRHGYVPVTEAPGDCDLTSHVDFEALRKALRIGGAAAFAALTQRDFLTAMGLEQRFARLASNADEQGRKPLERQMTRLAGEDQMGKLFKVLAAASPGVDIPYPFDQA